MVAQVAGAAVTGTAKVVTGVATKVASVVQTAVVNTATTAATAAKGVGSSVASPGMGARFGALANARSSAASMSTRAAPGPSASIARTPVGQSLKRGVDRAAASQRSRGPALQSPSRSFDLRDRALRAQMEAMTKGSRKPAASRAPQQEEVAQKEDPHGVDMLLAMARKVRDVGRRTVDSGKGAINMTRKVSMAHAQGMQFAMRRNGGISSGMDRSV